MCWFEIRVKRVYKDAVKALPKGLDWRQTAEKQHSWPSRLLGIMNSFELKRERAHTYANENEEQLWGFSWRICIRKCYRRTIKQLRKEIHLYIISGLKRFVQDMSP